MALEDWQRDESTQYILAWCAFIIVVILTIAKAAYMSNVSNAAPLEEAPSAVERWWVVASSLMLAGLDPALDSATEEVFTASVESIDVYWLRLMTVWCFFALLFTAGVLRVRLASRCDSTRVIKFQRICKCHRLRRNVEATDTHSPLTCHT